MSRTGYAKGVARREEILEGTLRVIAENGYSHASVRAIGRELGIEAAHILYYFSNREVLMREVLERWDSKNTMLGDGPRDGFRIFAGALRDNVTIPGVVHLYLSFATESVDAEHPAHEYFRQRFLDVSEMLRRTVLAGQQAGLIRQRVDPQNAARMIIGLADGLQLQSLMDSDVDAPGLLDAFISDLFVDGVQKPLGPISDLFEGFPMP